MRALRLALPPVVVLALALAAWEAAVAVWKLPPFLLPAPSAVARAAWVDAPRMLAATLETAKAAVGGFALAAALGVALGSLLGASRALQRGFYPLALLFQMVPLVAIAPLLVLWFGYGLRSTIAHLGGEAFPRLRIGIGRPAGQRPVADHVLTPFDARESAEVAVAVAQAADIVRAVLEMGVEKAMSRFNTAAAAAATTQGSAPKRPRGEPKPEKTAQ